MTSKILQHPSLLHAQEIADICKPLNKLNISYFSHVRIDHKKKFSAVGNNPQFAEHYLKNKFYVADIHMVDEKKFGDFFVWDGIQFSGESKRLCEEAHGFGIHNPFTMIVRDKLGINYYHFANDSTDKQINQAYLANLDLLQLFIAHFKASITQSKSLSKAYDLTFDLSRGQTKNFENEAFTYDRSEFLQSIAVKKPQKLVIDNVTLSKRQSEVLQHLIYGKTIKEISHLMGLSERTTGHYLETVKLKLNVSSRSELVGKALESTAIKSLMAKNRI